MITTSEFIVTATIWVMTACGVLFAVRGMLRRHKITVKSKIERQQNQPQ